MVMLPVAVLAGLVKGLVLRDFYSGVALACLWMIVWFCIQLAGLALGLLAILGVFLAAKRQLRRIHRHLGVIKHEVTLNVPYDSLSLLDKAKLFNRMAADILQQHDPRLAAFRTPDPWVKIQEVEAPEGKWTPKVVFTVGNPEDMP